MISGVRYQRTCPIIVLAARQGKESMKATPTLKYKTLQTVPLVFKGLLRVHVHLKVHV